MAPSRLRPEFLNQDPPVQENSDSSNHASPARKSRFNFKTTEDHPPEVQKQFPQENFSVAEDTDIDEVIEKLKQVRSEIREINERIAEVREEMYYKEKKEEEAELKHAVYQYLVNNDMPKYKNFTVAGCAPNDVKRDLQKQKKIESLEEGLSDLSIHDPVKEKIVEIVYPPAK